MSEYTDKDRERSQETHTMLKDHIKHNDERIADIKNILKIQSGKIEDNEKKIVNNEKLITKVMTIYSIVMIPVIAALATFGKKFIGN